MWINNSITILSIISLLLSMVSAIIISLHQKSHKYNVKLHRHKADLNIATELYEAINSNKSFVACMSTVPRRNKSNEVVDLEKTAALYKITDLEELLEADETADSNEIGESNEVVDLEKTAALYEIADLEELLEADEIADSNEIGESDEVVDLEKTAILYKIVDSEKRLKAVKAAFLEKIGKSVEAAVLKELLESDRVANLDTVAKLYGTTGYLDELKRKLCDSTTMHGQNFNFDENSIVEIYLEKLREMITTIYPESASIVSIKSISNNTENPLDGEVVTRATYPHLDLDGNAVYRIRDNIYFSLIIKDNLKYVFISDLKEYQAFSHCINQNIQYIDEYNTIIVYPIRATKKNNEKIIGFLCVYSPQKLSNVNKNKKLRKIVKHVASLTSKRLA